MVTIMISKINRFHGHNSLNPVYKHGQAVSLSQISLKHLPSRPGKDHRLAVVISKKVNKSAVVRNRIRRRIYELLRKKILATPINSDIVVNVYNEQVATMKSSELDKIISGLLVKSLGLTEAKAPDHVIVNSKREPI